MKSWMFTIWTQWKIIFFCNYQTHQKGTIRKNSRKCLIWHQESTCLVLWCSGDKVLFVCGIFLQKYYFWMFYWYLFSVPSAHMASPLQLDQWLMSVLMRNNHNWFLNYCHFCNFTNQEYTFSLPFRGVVYLCSMQDVKSKTAEPPKDRQLSYFCCKPKH